MPLVATGPPRLHTTATVFWSGTLASGLALAALQRVASLSPRISTLKNDARWTHERASTAVGADAPSAAARNALRPTSTARKCLKEVKNSRGTDEGRAAGLTAGGRGPEPGLTRLAELNESDGPARPLRTHGERRLKDISPRPHIRLIRTLPRRGRLEDGADSHEDAPANRAAGLLQPLNRRPRQPPRCKGDRDACRAAASPVCIHAVRTERSPEALPGTGSDCDELGTQIPASCPDADVPRRRFLIMTGLACTQRHSVESEVAEAVAQCERRAPERAIDDPRSRGRRRIRCDSGQDDAGAQTNQNGGNVSQGSGGYS
jgi:hypothetical protein